MVKKSFITVRSKSLGKLPIMGVGAELDGIIYGLNFLSKNFFLFA